MNELFINDYKEKVETGRFYEFETVITQDTICKVGDKVLFILVNDVVSDELGTTVINHFKSVCKKNYNRRSGTDKKIQVGNFTRYDKSVDSGIIGYYDRSVPIDKKIIGSKVARTTKFTKNKGFGDTMPFFWLLNDCYRKYAHSHYCLQETQAKLSKLIIQDTVFSTVTINHNWRTCAHKDSGDFEQGLSVLTALGNFEGYDLVLPEYKLQIKIVPGSVLLMDSRSYHCNSPGTGDRYSFVNYLRTDINKYVNELNYKGETIYN